MCFLCFSIIRYGVSSSVSTVFAYPPLKAEERIGISYITPAFSSFLVEVVEVVGVLLDCFVVEALPDEAVASDVDAEAEGGELFVFTELSCVDYLFTVFAY